MSITPQMGINSPDVGDSNYPTKITSAFSTIDSHDHTTGNGVPIPTAGIADLAITTAKLGALSVTKAKLAALGQQISNSSGSFTGSSSTYADITNLNVTITTTGRPVFVGLMTNESGSAGWILATLNVPVLSANIKFLRDATQILEAPIFPLIASSGIVPPTTTGVIPSSFSVLDVPSAGTYTYKAQYFVGSGAGSLEVKNVKLFAFEL